MLKILHRKKTSLSFLTLLLAVPSSHAEIVDVGYKAFYSHIRKLNNEDTKDLQFAFGFKHIETNELCVINDAHISTQKQQIPLSVSPENRFTVQSEKALRLANATIVVDIEGPANKCDMSVQLETKPQVLVDTYTSDDLLNIYSQYQAFFNEMGSFLSFMMPTVQGLRIQLADESLITTLESGHKVKAGMLSLSEADINKLDSLSLPSTPIRITAIAGK